MLCCAPACRIGETCSLQHCLAVMEIAKSSPTRSRTSLQTGTLTLNQLTLDKADIQPWGSSTQDDVVLMASLSARWANQVRSRAGQGSALWAGLCCAGR